MDTIGNEYVIHTFFSCDNAPNNLLQEFINLYKPISYINKKINNNIDTRKYKNPYSNNIPNMISHFINKRRVFSLLEQHIKITNTHYDVVLSTRLDLVYKSKFNFRNTEPNTLYIPNCCDYNNGINDQIAYGDFNSMNKYMSIYNNTYMFLKAGIITHPETLTLKNINYYNLKTVRFPLSYNIKK
jgi:hypothetical protein